MNPNETKLIVLDGGMGEELLKRGKTSGGLWSAQALLDAPEMVADVHRAYIQAGAEVIITNTYSTVPSYLAKQGREAEYLALAKRAGEIARAVADEYPGVRVAGSLPPLDESYRFDLVPNDEDSRPVYSALAETLGDYVDLFLCETMSCVRESLNAVIPTREQHPEKPLWVSWTLNESPGQGLRSGESLTEAVDALSDYEIAAYLFNCTTPEAISVGLRELRSLTDVPIGAYPNLFHVPPGWTLDNDVPTTRTKLSESEFVAFAREWQDSGASIIGGCCGIGPAFIQALAQA